jgi:hypothetical protein
MCYKLPIDLVPAEGERGLWPRRNTDLVAGLSRRFEPGMPPHRGVG